jgi:hypothetical protein
MYVEQLQGDRIGRIFAQWAVVNFGHIFGLLFALKKLCNKFGITWSQSFDLELQRQRCKNLQRNK